MRKYNIPPAFSSSLQLGRQGENGVTEITFLCAGYAKMYGDGFAEAVHRTPDGTTYPVNIEQDENNRVSWLISDGDTATAGTGQLELRWMVNGNLAKSKIFSTIIKSALTAPETPPDAAKSWVDKVLKAAEDIKEGAIDDEKLAKAIAEYLENHPIESGITEQNVREIAQSIVDSYQEKDPTVPEWAKAETKPTYTAAEVGAVPESAKTDIDKNTAARHTHSNKSALDSISESDIAKWNSGTAGTVEITGATGLAAGSAPTVTETADSTAQARKYMLGIPAGANGTKGENGADGKSAYQFAQEAGYTGTETEFGAKLNQTTFANPFPLTFTGAATGTYDGSAPLTVNIPTGGGGTGSGGESNLITRYVHSSNKEIYPTALDLGTGVFTCENHGLTTGDAAIVVCDYWFSFIPYELIMTKRQSTSHPTIRVVDGNTFTLQYDNADITYTSNLNTKVDVTKWHIEVSNPGTIVFTGFSAKSLEVRVSGWVWGTRNYSLAVYPMVDGNQVLSLNGGAKYGKLGCDNNSTVCVFVSGTIYLNNEFECNSYVVGAPANDTDYTYGGNNPTLPSWGSRCATKQTQYTWPLEHHAKFDGVALTQNFITNDRDGGSLMVTNGFTVKVYKHE